MSTNKSLYVVGPTSSGKSDFAIDLAKEFSGEVIGCDSRQIYRHMNIGAGKESGKIVKRSGRPSVTSHPYVVDGVDHFMIDTHHPNTDYNAGKFIARARRIQSDIARRGSLPIICGGTMFWAQGLLEGVSLPHVSSDPALRKELETQATETLLKRLASRDPRRYKAILTTQDQANRPRIIRALEIVAVLGSVPPEPSVDYNLLNQNNLIIVPEWSTQEIRDRIKLRLDNRLDAGMLDEVYALHHTHGVAWSRLMRFGLEYDWCTRYIRGDISQEVFLTGLENASYKYAKRQNTWLRRWEKKGAKIHYVKNSQEALDLTENFLPE